MLKAFALIPLIFAFNASAEEMMFSCTNDKGQPGLIAMIDDNLTSGVLLRAEENGLRVLGKAEVQVGEAVFMSYEPPEVDWSKPEFSDKCSVNATGYSMTITHENNAWTGSYWILPVAWKNPNVSDCPPPRSNRAVLVKYACEKLL